MKRVLMIMTVVLAMAACKKKEKCEAGLGGEVEVSVSVAHHDSLIPGAIVYVKFDATEFPGTNIGVYDLTTTAGTEGHAKGHAHIEGLQCGSYYFYSVGYDSSISQVVKGGLPVIITQESGEKSIKLAVTED